MGRLRVYASTRLGEGQIRVLSLDSSPCERAPLSGALHVQQIDDGDRPEFAYEALSYAWESPETVTGIFIRWAGHSSESGSPAGPSKLAVPTDLSRSISFPTSRDSASTNDLASSVSSMRPASSVFSASMVSSVTSVGSDLSQRIRDGATRSGMFGSHVTTLPLTHNLASALKHLRPKHGPPRRLWVDSVCIDQENLTEKGAHIPSMGHVYEKASRTLIWLGPAAYESSRVVRFIKLLAILWRNEDRRSMTIEWAVHTLRPIFESLLALLERSWWSRLWVIQEVLKAREQQVFCGADEVPLESFRIISEFNRQLAERETRPYFVYHAFSEVFTVLQSYREASQQGQDVGMPLFTWVERTQGFSCANSRDRIYALLSLCNSAERMFVSVSYDSSQLSNQLLQVQATGLFLRNSKSLRPLLIPWRKELMGLPSWTPDWSTSQKNRWIIESGHACGPYETPRYTIYRPAGRVDEMPMERCLFIKGWVVDTVTYMDPFPDIDHLFNEFMSSRASKQTEVQIMKTYSPMGSTDAYESASPYGRTFPDLWAAFWRTVSASAAKNPVLSQHLSTLEFISIMDSLDDLDSAVYQLVLEWFVDAVGYLHQRCFVITEAGHFGLAPARGATQTAEGDRVCILPGAETPVVLHQFELGPSGDQREWVLEDDGAMEEGGLPAAPLTQEQATTDGSGALQSRRVESPYTWVGGCYIHGMMNGEWAALQGEQEMTTFAVL